MTNLPPTCPNCARELVRVLRPSHAPPQLMCQGCGYVTEPPAPVSGSAREAFEAWVSSLQRAGFSLTRQGDGYYTLRTDSAWRGWQAALQSASRAPEGQEAVPVAKQVECICGKAMNFNCPVHGPHSPRNLAMVQHVQGVFGDKADPTELEDALFHWQAGYTSGEQTGRAPEGTNASGPHTIGYVGYERRAPEGQGAVAWRWYDDEGLMHITEWHPRSKIGAGRSCEPLFTHPRAASDGGKEGMVLVPREPTEAMEEAAAVAWLQTKGFAHIYHAMIAAAPPAGEGDG